MILQQPRDALDVAIWARLNGLLILPGQAKSKKPMSFLWGDNKIEGDSYHVPSEKRIASIRQKWKNIRKGTKEDLISATFDTEYPDLDHPTVFIAALDLDTDKFYDVFMAHPSLQRFPAVRGKKGAKVFIKVDYAGEEKPKNAVYQDPVTGENSLEILTKLKLAFIYGEHPDSTRAAPIFYRYVRGFNLDVTPDVDNGDFFEVTDDNQIPTVTYAEFNQIIATLTADLGLVKKEGRVASFSNVSPMQHLRNNVRREERRVSREASGYQTLSTRLGLRVEDICMPDNATPSGRNELMGAHPFHGSTTGQNFRINTDKNVWQCFSSGHDSGGDPLMAYAMSKGIVHCEDCHPGLFDDPRLMREVIEALRRDGYPVDDHAPEEYHCPGPVPLPASITDIPVITDRETLPTIEELADGPMYIHISASPRKGKTHRIIEHAMMGCPSATYITHTHATCGQAFRIAKDISERMVQENNIFRTVLWMAGKNKCCINDDRNDGHTPCQSCSLFPGEEKIPFERYEWMAEHMINSVFTCISPDILKEYYDTDKPDKYCPYYILREAEQYSDVCITVPHFVTINDKGNQILPRNTVIIDEDTTLASLYPGSVELASYTKTSSQRHFDHKMDQIKSRVDAVKEAATTKNGKPKKRLRVYDNVILEVSKTIDSLHSIIHDLMERPDQVPEDATRGFNLQIHIDGHEIDWDTKIKTIKKVTEYERGIPGRLDDDNSVSRLFEIILFNYEKNPLFWQGTTKKKLFLIGDEENLVWPVGSEEATEKIIVIGFTRAEKFIANMQQIKAGESLKYDIKKFDYGKNFTLVKVGANSNDTVLEKKSAGTETPRKNSRQSAKRRFTRFMKSAARHNKTVHEAAVPSIVLTSSGAKQSALINKQTSSFYPLNKEDLVEIERLRRQGAFLVVVSNSTFTRGIDVDKFDVLWVENTDYSQPYCDAVKSYAESTGDENLLNSITQLRYSYIVDEITNCVLRVSPIKGRDEDQAKIIIMPDYDAERIHPKVLEDMHVIEYNDDSKSGNLWKTISMASRKVNLCVDDLDKVAGLSWQEAREEFDRFEEAGPEEGELARSIRRERADRIDRTILNGLKINIRLSKAALINYVKVTTRLPGLRDKDIEPRLSLLCNISKITSNMDVKKGVLYYRFRFDEADKTLSLDSQSESIKSSG